MRSTEEKMIAIIRAILIHQNGYREEDVTDEMVLENEGSDLWYEIEQIIEK